MNIRVTKKLPIILAVVILLLIAGIFAGKMIVNAKAANDTAVSTQTVKAENTDEVTDGEVVAIAAAAAMEDTGTKALAAALTVGLAAAAGAVAMGIAIAKSAEGISRQPEAEGSIRTSLMLGLVFIETAIIYALIVAILIIFVM